MITDNIYKVIDDFKIVNPSMNDIMRQYYPTVSVDGEEIMDSNINTAVRLAQGTVVTLPKAVYSVNSKSEESIDYTDPVTFQINSAIGSRKIENITLDSGSQSYL